MHRGHGLPGDDDRQSTSRPLAIWSGSYETMERDEELRAPSSLHKMALWWYRKGRLRSYARYFTLCFVCLQRGKLHCQTQRTFGVCTWIFLTRPSIRCTKDPSTHSKPASCLYLQSGRPSNVWSSLAFEVKCGTDWIESVLSRHVFQR